MASPDRQQALRRRHRRERQAVVFGSLLAGLLVAGLGAVAVYTDVLDVPFLQRDFSTPTDDTAEGPAAPPCPPADTMPVAYGKVTLEVLNGTARGGLAGETGEALVERGFKVTGTGNATVSYPGEALISFGQKGLAAAYTLAAQFEAAELRLDLRQSGDVDLVLGDEFSDLLDTTAVTLDPEQPLAGPDACVALDQALLDAAPAPVTPKPTATATKGGSGG